MTTDAQPSVVSGTFHRPFKEQVAFFRNKLKNPVPTARWDDIKKEQHDVSFMVAGAQKADLLADLGRAIDKAIAKGTSLDAFRKDFKQAVKNHNWHGWTGEGTQAGEAWRTRTIYSTNAATSYAAARYAQLKEGGFDLWVYHHAEGVAHPRPWHLAWNGLTLPHDDDFWSAHYPPQGFHCHCFVTGARSQRGAVRQGGDPDKPRPDNWDKIDPKTGEPIGIDKGWGYAPGASVVNSVNALKGKLTSLPAPLGARFWESSVPMSAKSAQHQQWVNFLKEATEQRLQPQGRQFIVGSIPSRVLTALDTAHPELTPATAGIVITDKALSHMLRDKKFAAVAAGWLDGLPEQLHQPDAVLLDASKVNPALLFVYHRDNGIKLVIQLDYALKKAGQVNLLNTARELDARALLSLQGQVKGGEYELLEGSL